MTANAEAWFCTTHNNGTRREVASARLRTGMMENDGSVKCQESKECAAAHNLSLAALVLATGHVRGGGGGGGARGGGVERRLFLP